MLKRVLIGLMALLVSVTLRASAAPLTLGDAAPKMEVKEFVKGEPVTAFKKGKIYVVEFWATWCGPCRTSIPHLTEMAKKHKDITFVGVSAFEKDQALVKPFVTSMGDKMDYHVAMDMVPEGGKAPSGKMATNWMTASGQSGIPTAFIIDKETKVAWIGHPMEMDKPLDMIEAGKWNLTVAKAEIEKKAADQKKMQALDPKIRQAGNDPIKILAVLDEAIQSDPDIEEKIASYKFSMLLSPQGDPDKAAAYSAHLTETFFKDNVWQLESLAWRIVDPKQPKRSPKLLKVALQAALRADDVISHKDSDIANTLARAYFANGDTAKAIETQTRAVKLARGTALEKDASLAASLEEYKKASSK